MGNFGKKVLITNKFNNMLHNNKVYHLNVDGTNFEWHQSEIKGAEIRQLSHIQEEDQIFLKINNQGDDRLIHNDDTVDLSTSGY